MAITIRTITGKKEMKLFTKFRIDLYKGNEFAVPPLYADEWGTLNPKNNPAFDFSEAQCFMAFDGDKPVGRICALINNKANETWGTQSGRFGYIDFIDDIRVTKALLDAASQWVKERGMHSIHGPLGFTDMDQEGMLVEGYDQLSTMATIYNYPYYSEHMEKLGYVKDAEWVEYKIFIPEGMPEKHKKISELVMKKYDLRILKFKSAKKLIKQGYGEKLFALVNECYKELYGYTELTQRQIDFYIKNYISLARLDFITLVVDKEDNLIGLGVTIPSMSRALQKAQGKLFPFGFVHLLKALWSDCKVVDLLLIAVRPDFQSKGVNALMFYDLIPHYQKAHAEWGESHPELVTNQKVQSQWEYFEHKQHKRRRVYIKEV